MGGLGPHSTSLGTSQFTTLPLHFTPLQFSENLSGQKQNGKIEKQHIKTWVEQFYRLYTLHDLHVEHNND